MPSRLKSLELHGYKTFANRTFFEFADTVTAIVGPNGSGKSNIADSLRWVLGEQSYSLLRARKTEDMIFAGSESRSRAGMASATITFDNSDDWLPIDFSEVAITRRAYRDGLNEYLLNGQRVRLRDISELLAESGLAERTYTIIGQGLVDAALSLKADERRRLFEEAAGIGLHRSRREEAIRRLDTTKRNLERVEDILAELKPRLVSLERQARRAQEYGQVQADLQMLLRDWYGFHWHEAQNELTQAMKYERQQESKLEAARREHETAETKLAELRELVQTKREDLNSWHKALAEHHLRREEAIRKLSMEEERNRSLARQNENDLHTLNSLHLEFEILTEQKNASTQEIERLTLELEEAKNQTESTRKVLEALQIERQKIETRIQAIRQELNHRNAEHGKISAQLIESQSQAQRDSDSIIQLQNTLKEAESRFQLVQDEYKSAQEIADRAEKELKSVETTQEAFRKKLRGLEAKIAKARADQSSLQADEARLLAALDILKQADSSLSGYTTGTRILLQAARQDRLKGARGSLNEFLQVPEKLEVAIASVLGEYLDAVIIEDDPESALEIMDADSGRGVLLPLQQLKSIKTRLHDVKTGEDILGKAVDLVSFPQDFQVVVDLLLGGVIVVRDRKAARRVLNGQTPGTRAVTLRGDVYYASGPIFSGIPEENSDQTLLGRARQKRKYIFDLERLQEKIQVSEAFVEKLNNEYKEMQSEGLQLEEKWGTTRQHYLISGRSLDQIKGNYEHAKRYLDWSNQQLEKAISDREFRLTEINRLSDELSNAEKNLAETRLRLKQSEDEMTNLELDDIQNQFSYWSTREAVSQRAVIDAQSRDEERKQAVERALQSIDALKERIERIDQEMGMVEKELAEAHLVEEAFGAEISSLNLRIAPVEAEIRGYEKQQAVLQQENNTFRQAVSHAEQLHSQTRIQLARRQEGLQALQRRIEDDFGIVNFEYDSQVSGPTPLPLMGMVEELPIVRKLAPDIEENIKRQRAQLRRIGPVNPEAQTEYEEVRQRYEFMIEQVADLQKAESDIRQVIAELDDLMRSEFQKTFDSVAGEFRQIFTRLFGGGTARLILTDPEDLSMTGIEIEARLPGRRSQGLALLSGGERSLTAVSLVFALLRVSPTPFCVLDEVDAMLDEANVGRFRELLRELSQQTQFIIVTHNRNTVQVADFIYGVTMGTDSSSQVLSLKLDEIEQVLD